MADSAVVIIAVLIRRLGRVQIACIVMIVLGLIGGCAFDPKPTRPVTYRGGYRVLEADFHAHTTFSDGSLSPIGLVRQAERRGLDVIAVTEHNTVLASKIARAYANAFGGANAPIVVTGEEVTTARFHIIALGLESTVSANQSPKEVIDAIHEQRGLAIAAHPVEHFWPALLPVRGMLDGSEVLHPIYYSSSRGGGGRTSWHWPDMVTFYEDAQPPITAIGSSDYHWGSILGLCRTLVFVKEPATASSVVDALRAGHTVVATPDGRRFGDRQLIALLDESPYVERVGDYRYEGSGVADRVLRTIGWLGAVGINVFRRRRRPKSKSTATARDDVSAEGLRGR